MSSSEKASRFAEAFSDYKRCLRELSARGPAAGEQQPKALEAMAPAPPPAAPAYVWKSLPFLQASDPASPQHAIKLMEQFLQMLKADVDGFSGAKHSMAEWETFIRTLASAPGVLKVFLDRSPALALFAGKLTAAVNTMARDSVVQVRKGIEGADSAALAEPDAQTALRAAREAEQALRT